MSGPTTLLPFQPATMTGAQLAAVSFLARYSGRTHSLYAYQLREWFAWCESNGVDPLVGVQRAHVELYIRGLGDRGLMDSSVVTMMHAVRGYFRFAHIDGLISSDPAVYARLPKIHRDESRTHGLDRLELIRFLQVAQTLTVHHCALAYLLGINALRAAITKRPRRRRSPARRPDPRPPRRPPNHRALRPRPRQPRPTRRPLPDRIRRRRLNDLASPASIPPRLTRSWGGQGIADVWRWGSSSIHFKLANGMRTAAAPSPVLKKIAETGSPVIRINPETAEVAFATAEARTREHRALRARV
jgi:Phage integrase, N-terminal SAM-like domain